jgi:hypothetical protein
MYAKTSCIADRLLNINPLQPELNAHCFLQKIQDLNCHPLIFVFVADDLSGYSVF